jgi:uncharacterized damage-inducible protein DinB
MLLQYRRFLAFDHWASLETLTALESVIDRAPNALGWMNHVAGTKRLWYARVNAGIAPLAVWPSLSTAECRAQLIAGQDEWDQYIQRVSDSELARFFAYTNTRGEAFTSSLRDILAHLAIHGQHHRGQALAEIRAVGGKPPVIDFIHAARLSIV